MLLGTSSIPAYSARPARGTNLPVVWRRLAKLGYLAIAPRLFERQGDVTQLPDILDATAAWAARQDDGIPLKSVERVEVALKQAGSPSRIVVFPEAPHGFHADDRPTSRAAEAAEGWTQMLAWFRRYGVG